MPVDRLKDQREADLDIQPGSNQESALRLLATTPDTAYKPSEIEDETEIPEGSGPKVLSRLSDKSLVGSEKGYYYVNNEKLSDIRLHLGETHQRKAMKEVTSEMEKTDKTTEAGDKEPVTKEEVEAELKSLEEMQ